MSQEAVTEIDTDVFSRRIGPYFTWLESRIESGWQQSDDIQKDLLKEVKYLATTMRARFILGVSREDFTKEVHRAVELFELASEAFPGESDEVESKLKHFCKGVQEELGAQFIPAEYRIEVPRPIKPLDPHPFPTPDPMPMPEPDEPGEPEEPDEEKISQKIEPVKAKVAVKKPVVQAPKIEIKQAVEAPKVEIKKEVKIAKPKAKKVETPKIKQEIKSAPVKKAEPKAKAGKPRKSRKSFFLVRWVKGFIWGSE
jgi:hypothetical protein